MDLVCFLGRSAWVLLVHFSSAHSAATLGVVTQSDLAQARVRVRASRRWTGRRRVLARWDPGLAAVLRITAVVLVVTLVWQVFR
jgi:hypothetical protein